MKRFFYSSYLLLFFLASPVFGFDGSTFSWADSVSPWVSVLGSFTLSIFVLRYAWQKRRTQLRVPVRSIGVGLLLIATSFLSVLVSWGEVSSQKVFHDTLFVCGFGLIAYGIGRLPDVVV